MSISFSKGVLSLNNLGRPSVFFKMSLIGFLQMLSPLVWPRHHLEACPVTALETLLWVCAESKHVLGAGAAKGAGHSSSSSRPTWDGSPGGICVLLWSNQPSAGLRAVQEPTPECTQPVGLQFRVQPLSASSGPRG